MLTFVLIVALLIGMKSIEANIVSLFEGPTTSTFYVGDFRYALAESLVAEELAAKATELDSLVANFKLYNV